jgi:hypothetical protein
MTAETAPRMPAARPAQLAAPRSLSLISSPGLPLLRPARTPFVGLVVLLIVAGLMALLTLNTALQQASFTVSRLERQSAALLDREQALAQQVAVQEAPQRLAERARALGMVPSETPAFIRAGDGTVLGLPTPANRPVEVPVEVLVPGSVPGGVTSDVADAAPELPIPADAPVPGAPLPIAEVPGVVPEAPVPAGVPADAAPPAVGPDPVGASTP